MVAHLNYTDTAAHINVGLFSLYFNPFTVSGCCLSMAAKYWALTLKASKAKL